MAEALAKILGQPIVVLNRAGAGGTIAAAAAAKVVPDGYTILQANTNHSFSQTFYKNLGYDLEKTSVRSDALRRPSISSWRTPSWV